MWKESNDKEESRDPLKRSRGMKLCSNKEIKDTNMSGNGERTRSSQGLLIKVSTLWLRG